jgi:hypothetical protein
MLCPCFDWLVFSLLIYERSLYAVGSGLLKVCGLQNFLPLCGLSSQRLLMKKL